MKDVAYTITLQTARDDTLWVHFDLYAPFTRAVLLRLVRDITHQFGEVKQDVVYCNIPFSDSKIRKLAEWLGFEWIRNMRTSEDWGVRTVLRLDRNNAKRIHCD